MILKFRFWNVAEKKMYDVLSLHVMTGMVEVEGGKYFLVPQDGFLMQSTGLFDKNGVEIFEGDICKNEDGEVFTFILHSLLGVGIKHAVGVEYSDMDTHQSLREFTSYVTECVEVVDNIYENPELVEVKND